MTYKEAQQLLNKKFIYLSDTTGEKWTILDVDTDKGAYGDCEDYVLTLAYLVEDKSYVKFWLSFITFKHVIWQGKTPSGQPHAFMWTRGVGWTDNITKEPMTRSQMKALGYKFWWPIVVPLMIAKFALRPLFYLINKLTGY